MALYSALRDTTLILADEIGNTDAQTVAEKGLEETMKYVASKVLLDSLVSTATFIWLAAGDQVELFTAGGFNITDASSPLEPLSLFVGTVDTNGIPYVYRRFLQWKDLQAQPGRLRTAIFGGLVLDERPERTFTINASDEMELFPEPAVGKQLTLHYRLTPAPYADSTTPEIPARWDSLLINGAVMYVKEQVRQPEQIINPYDFFKALDEEITRMESQLRGTMSRPSMKIGKSYRVI